MADFLQGALSSAETGASNAINNLFGLSASTPQNSIPSSGGATAPAGQPQTSQGASVSFNASPWIIGAVVVVVAVGIYFAARK